MKKLYILLITLILLPFNSLYAEWEENIQNNLIIENTQEEKKQHLIKEGDFYKNTKLGEITKIDLSSIEKSLSDKLSAKIEFEWNIKWDITQEWSIFEKKFEKSWEKTINLNIYKIESNEKQLVTSEDISLFIYKNKSHIIFDAEMWNEEINKYIEKSTDAWIFVEKIAEVKTDEIEKQNFLELISQFEWLKSWNNNYLTLWWDKAFLSGVLSKITKERKVTNSSKTFNLVLVSPFNTDVLKSYLRNFLSNKLWIKSILLLPESSTSQIRYNPSDIEKLEKGLANKQYEYLKINTKSKITSVLFISQFINTLSNQGFWSNGIWLILIIPFLFTGISIMKHLIGLSPIWALIPIAVTLLLFQVWLISSAIIITVMVLINLLLSKVTNRYTLLYTPKISFIIIVNIAIIMILINILFSYNLINSNISHIIFIILFVLISERLITIILSKEFWEYKFSLFNTMLFAIVAYLFFSISFVQTLIFAYPEMILLLIPLNFIIWRFTWLRVTEYFRFKEVIQNIEE